MNDTIVSYRADCMFGNSSTWHQLTLRFATADEAARYINHVAKHWPSVTGRCVVQTNDPVNARFRGRTLTLLPER